MELTMSIKPVPYVAVPCEYKVKDNHDLESQIRNGIINAYVRSQAPLHLIGWVCYQVQQDYSLREIEPCDA